MLLKLISRCIIFYLLVIILCIRSQDIFDMFNDAKEHVAEKVQKHILNVVCFISSTIQFF